MGALVRRAQKFKERSDRIDHNLDANDLGCLLVDRRWLARRRRVVETLALPVLVDLEDAVDHEALGLLLRLVGESLDLVDRRACGAAHLGAGAEWDEDEAGMETALLGELQEIDGVVGYEDAVLLEAEFETSWSVAFNIPRSLTEVAS